MGHRLGMAANFEKETFGEEVNEVEEAPGGGAPATPRPDQLRRTFRFDGMVTPFGGMNLGANVSSIRFNGSKIFRMTFTLNWKIPKLNIPLKSLFLKETRDLEGLPGQYLMQAETKLSYNFRKIRVVVSHRLVGERLLSEEYSYNEFLARVSREFDVF